MREVLACFDLTGVVVTVDAMHTQTDTAQLITDGGGDYVCTVKANTPTLYRQLKDLPWSLLAFELCGSARRQERGAQPEKPQQPPITQNEPAPTDAVPLRFDPPWPLHRCEHEVYLRESEGV